MASESESSSPLEARRGRSLREPLEGADEQKPQGEIYLIERQAIDLRRRRWADVPKQREASRETSERDAREYETARAAAPPKSRLPDAALAHYARPRPDTGESPAGKGALARTAAWLRQFVLGD